MLTKPLVTAFCRNGVLFPRFVVATDANLDLCQRLIDIYREAAQAHTPAGELEDFLKPILNIASYNFTAVCRSLVTSNWRKITYNKKHYSNKHYYENNTADFVQSIKEFNSLILLRIPISFMLLRSM